MPKIYYCKNCHQFVDREGYFDIIKTPIKFKGICSRCKSKSIIFEVEYTNWIKIGKPFSIIFGIIIGILIFYLFHVGHTSSVIIMDYIWYFLFSLIISILFIIGMIYGFSIFDPEAAARKILKEHPELKKNNLKNQYRNQ